MSERASLPVLASRIGPAVLAVSIVVLSGCSRQADEGAGSAAPAETAAGSTSSAPSAATPPGSLASAAAPAAVSDLRPVPPIDLSGAEPGAKKQLGEQRAALDALLAKPETAPAELAAAFGDLGLLYVTYEFLDAAEVCFADAGALEPGSYRWIYLLGYLKSIQGKLPEAMPLFEKTLELAPSYLPAVLRLGRSRLELGQYPEAKALFERALTLDAKAAAAFEGLGKVAAAAGDHRAAVDWFNRALGADPAATGIHYALGQAYRNLGDLDRARAELEKSGDVVARIEDPLINSLASVAESAQFYLVQGAEALDDKDYQGAASSYRAAIDKDAGNLIAYRGLAFALGRLGDAKGVRKALEDALAKAVPENGEAGERKADRDRRRRGRAEVLALLGDLATGAGRDDEALERYRRSLALAPEQPAVLLKLANAQARRGRFADAVASYDRLIELAPAAAPLVLEKRATALVNLGRGAEAVADFRRAIEAAPNDAPLRLRFAEALAFLGDAAGAARERAAAEAMAPTGAGQAQLALAEARRSESAGDFGAAVAAYRRALESAPDLVEARFGLAMVLGHTGRYDAAAAELAKVIAASPRHLPARRGRILALVLGGRYGEARVELQEALKLFPRDADLALTQVRLLATSPDPRVRDGELAVAIATRVYADRKEPPVRESLALAYAAAGRFAEASGLQRDLVAEAERAGDSSLAAARRARLAAFEAGKPWSAASPDEIVAPLTAG